MPSLPVRARRSKLAAALPIGVPIGVPAGLLALAMTMTPAITQARAQPSAESPAPWAQPQQEAPAGDEAPTQDQAQEPVPPMPALPPEARPLPVLDASAASREAALLELRLRLALGPARVWTAPATTTRALGLGRAMLARSGRRIDRPQLLLLVDRAETVQRLWVVLAMPGDTGWTALGAIRISSGKPGKLEHFKTPVGVFDNDAGILGYRAQGTFNENHIRGIGLAGMRVWDFGWQTTEDWRKQGASAVVRLEMHATDPTFLASRLGRPDSEACIRIPDSFNQFMDQAGLIDARLLALVPQNRAITALLPKDRVPTALAGELVIVVDSSDPAATPSDPVRAQEINRRFAEWLAQQPASQPASQAASQQPAGQPTGTQNASGGTTSRRPGGLPASPSSAVEKATVRPSAYVQPGSTRMPITAMGAAAARP